MTASAGDAEVGELGKLYVHEGSLLTNPCLILSPNFSILRLGWCGFYGELNKIKFSSDFKYVVSFSLK